MEKKLRGKLEEEVKELRQGKELIHSLNDNEDFENLRLNVSVFLPLESRVSEPIQYLPSLPAYIVSCQPRLG